RDHRFSTCLPQLDHRAVERRVFMSMQQNTSATAIGTQGSTVDAGEVAKFSKLSAEWWDPKGKMAPLHKINPLRLGYIRDAACRELERNARRPNCPGGAG